MGPCGTRRVCVPHLVLRPLAHRLVQGSGLLDLGAELRSWCVQRGWILLWSLGLNLGPNAEVNYVRDEHSNPHFHTGVQLD